MNIEIENLLCARNARARVHARVYAPAQGSLSPVLLFLKTARFEKELVVFSRKVPLFLTIHHKFQNSQVFSPVMVCISRIVFLPLPSKDTQISALRSAARPLCQRLPYALGIDHTHDAPLCGMVHIDSPSHTWLAEQKGGNAQELAVMPVPSNRSGDDAGIFIENKKKRFVTR